MCLFQGGVRLQDRGGHVAEAAAGLRAARGEGRTHAPRRPHPDEHLPAAGDRPYAEDPHPW